MTGSFSFLLLAAGITIGVEAGVLWIAGFRSRREQAALFYTNAITFPLFRFWLFFSHEVLGFIPDFSGYVIFEILIWGAEVMLMSLALRPKRPFLLAGSLFCANTLSFFAGELAVWG